MNKLQKRIASALAAASMFANLAVPTLAASLEITGNGESSYNKVDVEVEQNTEVYQENNATVTNNVDASASTGGNDANSNTGGDVQVYTGDATTLVDVANTLNTNSADVDCCATGDMDVLISGNGSESTNKVYIDVNEGRESGTTLTQKNNASVTNNVDADAKTGYNDANRNTGGDVLIDTGKAISGASVSTKANTNSATVGGNGEGGTSLSARILGNGENSYNKIDLDFENNLAVFQTNNASVYNNVDAEATTGKNDANRNTGGEVEIWTGNATAAATVDNMVNFNWADLDCGCLFDVWAKVANNGADSYNKIKADLDDGLLLSQLNNADLNNNVDAEAKTGKNDANRNTGSVEGSDPSVNTGNAASGTEVNNSGNVNMFGDGFDFPEFDLDFDFSWAFFWAWMGMEA